MELLVWVADRPRTYADTMEAWRSTCPRHSVWEDAMIAGLVKLECRNASMGENQVTLTARGRAVLNRHNGHARNSK